MMQPLGCILNESWRNIFLWKYLLFWCLEQRNRDFLSLERACFHVQKKHPLKSIGLFPSRSPRQKQTLRVFAMHASTSYVSESAKQRIFNHTHFRVLRSSARFQSPLVQTLVCIHFSFLCFATSDLPGSCMFPCSYIYVLQSSIQPSHQAQHHLFLQF